MLKTLSRYIGEYIKDTILTPVFISVFAAHADLQYGDVLFR